MISKRKKPFFVTFFDKIHFTRYFLRPEPKNTIGQEWRTAPLSSATTFKEDFWLKKKHSVCENVGTITQFGSIQGKSAEQNRIFSWEISKTVGFSHIYASSSSY